MEEKVVIETLNKQDESTSEKKNEKPNKVAFVTGSARGIGKEIITEFAKNGFNVVLNYNTSKVEAEKTKKNLEKLGVKVLAIKADISNEKQVKNMIERVMKEFKQIDVLVNNSATTFDSLFCDKNEEEFNRVLGTNVTGTFLVSKYIGDIMYKAKRGKIINIASTNGINTYYPMCAEYDASKAGVISLTHNLAIQFAPYVTVNAVAPGFIATENEIKDMDEEYIKSETEKILVKRVGTARDVAGLVMFLTSEKANFINNTIIRIDGGMYGS